MRLNWRGHLWNILGILFGLLSGFVYTKFMHDLHENTLFFSSIKPVERLISMRTESGFYYSFYQQLVNAKSLKRGLNSLLNDTKSEYPHSINALQKFNIYPEVLLALVYRVWPFKIASVFFYAKTCFFFSGLSVTAAYFLSWVCTGEWIYGLAVGCWLLVNYEDSGRTNFVLNLRENFALPFLWFQFIFLVTALRSNRASHVGAFSFLTFLFSMCWQFSQYVLLLQSCVLFTVSLLRPQLHRFVRRILVAQSCGLFLTIVLHFFQPMLLTAPVLWLNCSIIGCTSLCLRNTTSFNLKASLITGLLSLLAFVLLMCIVKSVLNVQADSHIWTFFLAKFGFILYDEIPFETSIYLCHAGFTFTEYDFVVRTQRNGILQLYLLVIVVFFAISLFNFCKKRELPPADQWLVTVQSMLFAAMTYTTMRMKYVYLPQMAVVAACFFGFLDRFVGRYFKYVAICAVVTKLSMDHYQFYLKVLSRSQEFYDPDTVQLMNFIKKEPKANVYSGSMQLMAGVKCCTSRPITNHPHFEDKSLRDRTLRIYSMYARMPVEQVYDMLKAENSTHIIVENSICYTKSTGCALKDVIDTAYGYRTESGLRPFRSTRVYPISKVDRFCSAVENSVQSLFVRIFQNRTFRIYRLV